MDTAFGWAILGSSLVECSTRIQRAGQGSGRSGVMVLIDWRGFSAFGIRVYPSIIIDLSFVVRLVIELLYKYVRAVVLA